MQAWGARWDRAAVFPAFLWPRSGISGFSGPRSGISGCSAGMALTRDKHYFTIGLLEPKFWTFVLTAFADNFTGLYKEAANLKFVAEDIRMEERQLHANFRIINQIHATNIGTVLSFSNSRCSNFCSGFFRARWRVCMACQSLYVCVCIPGLFQQFCLRAGYFFILWSHYMRCNLESSYEIMLSMFCLQAVLVRDILAWSHLSCLSAVAMWVRRMVTHSRSFKGCV